MNSKNLKNRFITSIILLFFIFLIFKYSFFMVYGLIIIGIFSLIEFSKITKKICKKKLNEYFLNSLFIIYIFTFCFFFFFLAHFFQLKIILFIILLGCVASDIGGFIFGKYFKGPKLTKISPNKTISGAIGSFILTSVFVLLLFNYLSINLNLKILIISLTTSLGCQVGDLFFSYLKRKAKLKDTGNILPGHGGILDRVDGILVGLPLGIIILIFLFK